MQEEDYGIYPKQQTSDEQLNDLKVYMHWYVTRLSLNWKIGLEGDKVSLHKLWSFDEFKNTFVESTKYLAKEPYINYWKRRI